MRTQFPGHFRPTPEEFESLWNDCLFAVDANVLLNLYRYSPDTRQELERTLSSVKDRLFLPNQAAREFLKNRLNVTAGQAEEYTKAIRSISEISSTLSNKKRHPFLPDGELPKFEEHVATLIDQLEAQKTLLLERFMSDEILEFVDSLFSGRTGDPFEESHLKSIATEGENRYQHEIPPGYRDGKKDSSGDPYRKFGDLIVWKQLIEKCKEISKPIIFVSDDKKDDWWLEQSGRTIGPRTELREEFFRDASRQFWMYSVDRFVEEAAKISKIKVSKAVIDEIVAFREDARAAESLEGIEPSSIPTKIVHSVLTENEIYDELVEFLDSNPTDDRSVRLRHFAVTYLGRQNYEINHSYAHLNSLAAAGRIEIFQKEKEGRSSAWIRLPVND